MKTKSISQRKTKEPSPCLLRIKCSALLSFDVGDGAMMFSGPPDSKFIEFAAQVKPCKRAVADLEQYLSRRYGAYIVSKSESRIVYEFEQQKQGTHSGCFAVEINYLTQKVQSRWSLAENATVPLEEEEILIVLRDIQSYLGVTEQDIQEKTLAYWEYIFAKYSSCNDQ